LIARECGSAKDVHLSKETDVGKAISRIALLERFWQAVHPPRYAAYFTPSSPIFPHSSCHEQRAQNE
jgi:hypothetical protein